MLPLTFQSKKNSWVLKWFILLKWLMLDLLKISLKLAAGLLVLFLNGLPWNVFLLVFWVLGNKLFACIPTSSFSFSIHFSQTLDNAFSSLEKIPEWTWSGSRTRVFFGLCACIIFFLIWSKFYTCQCQRKPEHDTICAVILTLQTDHLEFRWEKCDLHQIFCKFSA